MEEKHEEQVKILDKHANVSLSFIVFTLIYPSTITYVYIISLKSQLIVIILYVDRRWGHDANCSCNRTCTKKSVQHLPFWRL